MRESRLGRDRGEAREPHHERVIPSPERLQDDSNVDKCVEALVEMGYCEDGGESAVERLKVYAQIADGNVDSAVEMLEEERKAWGQRRE